MNGASLGALAASVAASAFRGREPEISRFVELLADPGCLPHYLYVTGPVGIGKTALIGAVKNRVEAERLGDVVVIDATEFVGDPAAFERLLRTRTAPWPRTPDDGPVVVFIDSYERIGSRDRRRIHEACLTSVTGPVLLAVCQRQLPRDLFFHGAGWRSIIEEIPLPPLSLDDSFGLLVEGRLPPAEADEVVAMVGGNPLLIVVAGVVMGRAVHPDRRMARETTRLLSAKLRSEGMDDATWALVEVVALFPSLSEEALEAALGADQRDHIGEFTALSVVEVGPDGYSIAEPFRSWVALDLRSRRPKWCADIERVAVSASARDRGVDVSSGHRADRWELPVAPLRQSVSPEALRAAKQALDWLREGRVSDRFPVPASAVLADATSAEELRATLTGIIDGLGRSHSPRVAEAGRLLRNYHLNGSRSLEAVADAMNVSRATIFRRLRLGIELVAERLAERAPRETVASANY